MKTIYELIVQEIKALPISQRERLLNEFGFTIKLPGSTPQYKPEPVKIYDYDLDKVQQEAMKIAFGKGNTFSMLPAVKYIKDQTGLGLKEAKYLFEQTYKELAPTLLRIKKSLDKNGWIKTVSWLTEHIYHDRKKSVEAAKEAIEKYSYEFILVPLNKSEYSAPIFIEASSLRNALTIIKERTGEEYKEKDHGIMDASPFDGMHELWKSK